MRDDPELAASLDGSRQAVAAAAEACRTAEHAAARSRATREHAAHVRIVSERLREARRVRHVDRRT
jgi:hypothetical protein